jgi:hypothetical protein
VVTARFGGLDDAEKIGVTDAVLRSLDVQPAAAKIATGEHFPFTATGTYSDGRAFDLTQQVLWQTDNEAVATISNAPDSFGVATGVSAGNATIVASRDGIAAKAQLFVSFAPIQQLLVQPPTASRDVGQTLQLGAIAVLGGGTFQNVTLSAAWSSSNEGIASVSSTGVATCNAPGSVTIVASYQGLLQPAMLTCGQAVIVEIQVLPLNPTLRAGQQQPVTAIAVFSNGATQNVTNLAMWSVSDPGIATVNRQMRQQVVRGVGGGQTTLSASYMALTGSTTVTVQVPTVMAIQLVPSGFVLRVGQNQQLQATAVYDDGSVQNVTGMATWQSNDPMIASVSNTMPRGRVTGTFPGSTIIGATFMGVTGQASVSVTNAQLAGLSLSPVAARIVPGQRQAYTATGLYDDGTSQNVTGMTLWSSSDATVADITNGNTPGVPRGTATAFAPGTTIVTGTFMGVTDSVPLTVADAKITSIAISPSGATLVLGQSQAHQAFAIYDDGSRRDVTALSGWSSSDSSVADVTNGGGGGGGGGGMRGLVTARGPGTTTITATFMGISGQSLVTVTAATLKSLDITPVNASVPVGGVQQMQAVGLYSDNTTRFLTGQATWASTDPMVADVGNAGGTRGQVSGLNQGTAVITATFTGVGGKVLVSVAPIQQIQVTPLGPSTPGGLRVQFTATAVLSNNATVDVTAQSTWTSSDGGVVSVSNAAGSRGLATATSPGSSTIRATMAGAFGESAYTVGTQKLVSITVTPNDPMATLLPKGATLQLQATGVYDDMSTFDLTPFVTWLADDGSVVVVSNAAGSRGLATAVGSGIVKVVATWDGVSGTTVLNVP